MITAVDTNIFVDVINNSAQFSRKSAQALHHAGAAGAIVICDIVYAEACGLFSSQGECDSFLGSLGIKVESLDSTSCFLASRSWISYLKSGSNRARILPDFLIAGHATNQADQLLTRDTGLLRHHFPNLTVIHLEPLLSGYSIVLNVSDFRFCTQRCGRVSPGITSLKTPSVFSGPNSPSVITASATMASLWRMAARVS